MPTIQQVLELNLERIKDIKQMRKLVVIFSGMILGDLSLLSKELTELKDKLEKAQAQRAAGEKDVEKEMEVNGMLNVLTAVSSIAIGNKAKTNEQKTTEDKGDSS